MLCIVDVKDREDLSGVVGMTLHGVYGCSRLIIHGSRGVSGQVGEKQLHDFEVKVAWLSLHLNRDTLHSITILIKDCVLSKC